MKTTILYRPVGTKELELIEASGFKRFPPRLPEQPIFYPVTNEDYAVQIARDWNTQHNADKKGYVTRFAVAADYLARFDKRVVGGAMHEELWVPAEELEVFNEKIVGSIEVIHRFGPDAATRRDSEVAGFDLSDLESLHRHCSANRSALAGVQSCGCFYCLKIFDPNEIKEWISDDAVCPYCGIDSVLPASISPRFGSELLNSMRKVWFS